MFGRSTVATPREPAENSTEARARALAAMQSTNKALDAAEHAVREAERAMRGLDDVARLEAQAARPALLAAEARARADSARAAAEFRAADEAWRCDQAKLYFPKIAAQAQVLDRCLREAREANVRLGEIGAEARQNGGGDAFPTTDFQWPELQRWALWHARGVKAGYLED